MQYKNLNEQFGTVLKIDIDRRNISFFTVKSIQLLSRNFTLQKLIIKKSPSKKGHHIVLCLKEEMTDSEIIAWQFAIGSDKRRERYNLLRHTHGNTMEDWNILFSKKVKRKISFKEEIKTFYGQKYKTKIKLTPKEIEHFEEESEEFEEDEFDYTHR